MEGSISDCETVANGNEMFQNLEIQIFIHGVNLRGFEVTNNYQIQTFLCYTLVSWQTFIGPIVNSSNSKVKHLSS